VRSGRQLAHAPSFCQTISSLVLLLTSISAFADFNYVGETTNEIYKLNPSSSPGEVAQAYSDACKTIQRLRQDPDFTNGLSRAKNMRPSKTNVDMVRAAQAFTQSFVDPEMVALRRAGISDEVASAIMSTAKQYQGEVDWKQSLGATDLHLEKLKSHICKAKEEAFAALKRSELERRISLLVVGFGGVALIAVDLPAEAATAGLSSASLPLGVTLIGLVEGKTLPDW
jgi:hypothetical protein